MATDKILRAGRSNVIELYPGSTAAPVSDEPMTLPFAWEGEQPF